MDDARLFTDALEELQGQVELIEGGTSGDPGPSVQVSKLMQGVLDKVGR